MGKEVAIGETNEKTARNETGAPTGSRPETRPCRLVVSPSCRLSSTRRRDMNRRTLLSLLVLLGLLTVANAAPIGAAQDEPARGEILKIAINGPIQDPTNMNMTNWSADRANTGLHQVAYEYFFYDNLQTGEFIPWLAESYEYNDDATSLTVHLRDGVTWSDGEPFTSADVVFTYDLMRENPSMSWAVEASDAVASVEKVDDLTVTFNLAEPNPRFHLYREG